MPTSAIRWGSGLKNTLRLKYGLRDVITDREPRNNSEWSTTPGGAEDAWTNFDFTLQGIAQYAPVDESDLANASPVAGPDSWTEFVRWARGKQAFRFFPDAGLPNFYVDGCFLDSPLRGLGTPRTPSERDVLFKIRNPTIDFGQALRGLMFEYAPGASLVDPIAATYTRGSGATYRSRPDDPNRGLGKTTASGVLRDQHFRGNVQTTLVEGGATQLVTDPENFGNWSLLNTPVRTGGQRDPFGGTNAWLITDNDAGLSEGIQQTITFTADGTKSFGVFAKMFTAGISARIAIRDDTAGGIPLRCGIDVDWTAAGIPTGIVTLAGGFLGFEDWGDGWYRFLLRADGVIAANNNNIHLRIGGDNAADQGSVLFFGANGWNLAMPGSYQGPSLTTKNSDLLVFPFPYKPQAMFAYMKFIELGTINLAANADGGWLDIGKTGADRSFFFVMESSVNYSLYHRGSVDRNTSINPSSVYGDTIEMMGMLFPDGSVQERLSKNGAAELNAGPSAAFPNGLAAAWNAPEILLGGWLSGPQNGRTGIVQVKVGPLVYQGVTRNTIALARTA